MLSWTITFIVLALISGVIGLGGFAGTFAWLAHVCLALFIILFVVSLITGRKPSV